MEDQFLANLEACSPGPESSFPSFQDLEKSLQCQAGLKLGTCGQGIFWKVKKTHVSHFVICFIYHYYIYITYNFYPSKRAAQWNILVEDGLVPHRRSFEATAKQAVQKLLSSEERR